MKLRFFLISLAMLAAASRGFSDLEVGGAGGQSELVALDDAWIDAEVRHDSAALEKILDDGFLATFASGKTLDRTAFLAWITQAQIAPFSVVHDEIRVHGDTAVVVDSTADGENKFVWIAIKRDRQWRVIAETFAHVTVTK